MQRGQSHTVGGAAAATGGALAGQSNGFQQVGQTLSSQNNQALDQRSMSKDSHNRQQQFSNRALKNLNAEGRKSQLSGVSGLSASNAPAATSQGQYAVHQKNSSVGAHSIGKKQIASNVLSSGKANNKSTLRQQYGSNGANAARDRRDRMLSVGPNGLSHAIVGQVQGAEIARGDGQNPGTGK